MSPADLRVLLALRKMAAELRAERRAALSASYWLNADPLLAQAVENECNFLLGEYLR